MEKLMADASTLARKETQNIYGTLRRQENNLMHYLRRK